MARLSKQLIDNGQYEKLARAVKDRAYCYEKMVEYKVISKEEARQLVSAAIKSKRLSDEKETVEVRKNQQEQSENERI